MAQANCFGKIYDILAQSISILDVTTDIIVCIQFYQNDRILFFAISVSILILAFIAYDALFVHIFSEEYKFCREVALFMLLLPLSPFIPFVFYYAHNEESYLPKRLKEYCCFKLDFYAATTTEEASKFKQFFESKVQKHAGFIVESLVEAFPQAILQCTAIVIYNEANIAAIISILISLLSVASKSLVFSMGTSCNFKQLFFNWLCACTDFFGIFFVVCWVFWQPKDEHLTAAFHTISQVWFYKLYIFEVPMVFICCTVAYLAYIWAISTEDWDNSHCCKRILYALLGLVAFSFILVCAIIAALLVVEITNWTWIALTFLAIGTSRFPSWHKLSLEFWFTALQWINAAKKHHIGSKYKGCTSFTKKQDFMMRLSSVNYIALTTYTDKNKGLSAKDGQLVKYLEYHQNDNQYMNVTMRGLRTNNANPQYGLDENNVFWQWYGEVWREIYGEHKRTRGQWQNDRTFKAFNNVCFYTSLAFVVGSLSFFFAPIYSISRLMTLLFPGFIVLYLYFGYDVNIWNTDKIDMFQIIMITVYLVLCSIVSILFYFNVKEQYVMAHLLPSETHLNTIKGGKSEQIVESLLKQITNHYYGMTFVPIRRAMVIEKFGPDIGNIIVSYLPNNDDFDIEGDIIRAKVV